MVRISGADSRRVVRWCHEWRDTGEFVVGGHGVEGPVVRHLVDAGILPSPIDALALSKRPGDVQLPLIPPQDQRPGSPRSL